MFGRVFAFLSRPWGRVIAGLLVLCVIVGVAAAHWFTPAYDAGFAYAVLPDANTVAQYGINDDGSLVQLSPASVPTGQIPQAIAVSHADRIAYVVCADADPGYAAIDPYRITANGTLAPLRVSPPLLQGPRFAIDAAISPRVPYLYVVYRQLTLGSSQGAIVTYQIDAANGSLRTRAVTPTIGQPVTLALAPNGQFVYVAEAANPTGLDAIEVFQVDPTGSLIARRTSRVITSADADERPVSLTLTPNGRYAYLVQASSGPASSSITPFAVGSVGTLTALPGATTFLLDVPATLAMDPAGRFAFVIDTSKNTVVSYSIKGNGALRERSHMHTMNAAESLRIAPDGHHLYVLAAGGSVLPPSIINYAVSTNGILTLTSNTPTATPAAAMVIAHA